MAFDKTYDIVYAKNIKTAKHALIDWDLEDTEYSQVMIVSGYEALEGMNPGQWRLHFASDPTQEFIKAIDATCNSRKVPMGNVIVHNYTKIDDGLTVRK